MKDITIEELDELLTVACRDRDAYAEDLSAAQAEVERLRGELAEAEARAERAEAERDAALLATDKAVAAALEARAEDLDAKADAAFTAAVKAAEAGDEEREDAESARWTAYRVAARIVRGAP